MPRISRVSGLSRKKQVKFADPVDDNEPSSKQNASSALINRAFASNVKEAKTSEYKSFIKLREERCLKVQKHLPAAGIDTVKELENPIPSKYNNISIVPIPKAASFVQKSLHSPPHEPNRKVTDKYGIVWSQPPAVQITPIAQEPASHLKASQNRGTKQMHGGIFSKKRENILQEAAKVLSVERDYVTSNRLDLISGFLERLGGARTKSSRLDVPPESAWKKSDVPPESAWKKSNVLDQPFASSKPDDFPVGHETAGAHFSGTTAEKHLVRNLLCYGHNESDDVDTLPMSYVKTWDFPFRNDPKSDIQCKRRKYQGVDDGGISNLSAPGVIAETGFFENTVKQPFRKRYLTYCSSEADDNIESSTGYVESQLFPTWHPSGYLQKNRKHEWMLDMSGVSDLLAEDKSSLSLELHNPKGRGCVRNHVRNDFQKVRFREDDDLDASSTDDLEDRSALSLVWDGSEQTSYSGTIAGTHRKNDLHSYRFREADDLVASLVDCGEDKSALALEWHGTEGTAIAETNAGKYVTADLPTSCFREADDLDSSSMDFVEAQFSPSPQYVGADLQCMSRKSLWMSEDGRIRDLPLMEKSASLIEWNTDFGFDKFRDQKPNCMVSKSDCFTPDFSSHDIFTEKLLAPVCSTTSLERRDFHDSSLNLQSSEERNTLWLLDYGNNNDLESSIHDSADLGETNHLPLALYNASNFPKGRSNTTNSPAGSSVCSLRGAFFNERDDDSSTLGNGSELTFSHNWDDHLSTPRTVCEVATKSLPTSSDGDYSDFEFHETKMKNISNCISVENTNGDFLDDPNSVDKQFLGDTSSVPSFASFDDGFTDCEKGIFALMPHRLNWY